MTILEPLEHKLPLHWETIKEMEESATDHDNQLAVLQAPVSTLNAAPSKKCEGLVGRSLRGFYSPAAARPTLTWREADPGPSSLHFMHHAGRWRATLPNGHQSNPIAG